MGVVEGLTATIAQHNPDVDFNTMWASDSEEPKLDVHYREAITDLENHLAKWTSSTSTQYDLQALADDLRLTIKMLAYWPPRLSGLLTNQIQNYLVHAIMAGWLNDFPEIKTTDYASMGATDLDAIKEILLKKDFSFTEFNRTADAESKESSGKTVVANRVGDTASKEGGEKNLIWDRVTDEEEKPQNVSGSTGIRFSDKESKGNIPTGVSERTTDSDIKDNEGESTSDRNADSDVKGKCSAGVSSRTEDKVIKNLYGESTASGRHEDDARQCFREEQVDWGGGFPPFVLR